MDHILSKSDDSDMVLEFQLDLGDNEIFFGVKGNNLEIIWDDQTSVKFDKIDDFTFLSNKYEKSGNYIVRIKGELTRFSHCSRNIIKVINWNYYLKDLSEAFYMCNKLEKVPNYIPVNVTDMKGMFYECYNFYSDLSEWNVSNVHSMSGMFYDCKKFNSDLSKWNVSNVKHMSYMFYNCKIFNSDISEWNVSSVIDMSGVFFYCSNFNSDLSKWNVSNVQKMSGMFCRCYKFNSDISKWDVSNVQNMVSMFRNCYNFNSDISKWDVSNVQDMSRMFN